VPVSNSTATPGSIVDALKSVAGGPPKDRACFAKGRCVRGTHIPSDLAREITKSRSFTRPSPVLARFSVSGGKATPCTLVCHAEQKMDTSEALVSLH